MQSHQAMQQQQVAMRCENEKSAVRAAATQPEQNTHVFVSFHPSPSPHLMNSLIISASSDLEFLSALRRSPADRCA